MIQTLPNINEFDLAFVVDSTGSMGNLIKSAQRQMIDIVDSLAQDSNIHMHLGVVEYRDFPPQDQMPSRVYGLTENLRKVKRAINGLRASGGGDACEAVFAGLDAAFKELRWREHSRRIAVLIGDAPPHGVGGAGDGFPAGCPSGHTLETITAKAENTGVTVYAIGLNKSCKDSFQRLSRFSGGQFYDLHDGQAAMEQLRKILLEEFGELSLDREVLATWLYMQQPCVDSISKLMEQPISKVARSIARLQRRKLLEHRTKYEGENEEERTGYSRSDLEHSVDNSTP